ncbi:FmdB family zinc ribbon protein [Melioribacteraceae bacterium 4301-Me]|uniref:FmdB family zinc ribbon protein n=1 Tax=Pyranulibacter aquaticus TaxID=3163344 RepID=UPI00359AEA02
MPTYEFKCNKCNEKFSLTLSVDEYLKRKTFQCPKCKGEDVKRVFSSFTAVTSKKS